MLVRERPYDGVPKIIYGRTKDFRTVVRDTRGYTRWPMADGLISPWREGSQLYVFAGKNLRVMNQHRRRVIAEPEVTTEVRQCLRMLELLDRLFG